MNWDDLDRGARNNSKVSSCGKSRLPIFIPAVSDAFDHFTDLADAVQVGTSEFLLEQGRKADQVYLILSGLAKLVRTASGGRQATIGLRAAGWYVGAVSVLTDTFSAYSAVALTPCTVIRIPAPDFPLVLLSYSRMMPHLTQTLCTELISQSVAMVEVVAGTAEQRLATFMSERCSTQSNGSALDVLRLLKQRELARLLSITPEHLSRILHKTIKNGPLSD